MRSTDLVFCDTAHLRMQLLTERVLVQYGTPHCGMRLRGMCGTDGGMPGTTDAEPVPRAYRRGLSPTLAPYPGSISFLCKCCVMCFDAMSGTDGGYGIVRRAFYAMPGPAMRSNCTDSVPLCYQRCAVLTGRGIVLRACSVPAHYTAVRCDARY